MLLVWKLGVHWPCFKHGVRVPSRLQSAKSPVEYSLFYENWDTSFQCLLVIWNEKFSLPVAQSHSCPLPACYIISLCMLWLYYLPLYPSLFWCSRTVVHTRCAYNILQHCSRLLLITLCDWLSTVAQFMKLLALDQTARVTFEGEVGFFFTTTNTYTEALEQ
jgi:hypothetical protein